jgi:hypothetical protein
MKSLMSIFALVFLFNVIVANSQKIDPRPPFAIKWDMSMEQVRTHLESKGFDVSSGSLVDGSLYFKCTKDSLTFGGVVCSYMMVSSSKLSPNNVMNVAFITPNLSESSGQFSCLKKLSGFVQESYTGNIEINTLSTATRGKDIMDETVFKMSNNTTSIYLHSSYSQRYSYFFTQVIFENKKLLDDVINEKMRQDKKDEERSKKDL